MENYMQNMFLLIAALLLFFAVENLYKDTLPKVLWIIAMIFIMLSVIKII